LAKLCDTRGVEWLFGVATNLELEADLRRSAISSLEDLTYEIDIAPLIALLHDPDAGVRYWVASALGTIGSPEAVDPLIRTLKEDSDYEVRDGAVQALGKIGDQRAIPHLIDVLMDKRGQDSLPRSAAAKALGELGGSQVFDLLINIVNDREDSDSVRCFAASGLAKLGDRRGVDHLVTALKDTEWFVRYGATQALGNLGDQRALPGLLYMQFRELNHIVYEAIDDSIELLNGRALATTHDNP
jgi:HEAT repeat protein